MDDTHIQNCIDLCCKGETKAFEFIVSEYQKLVYTLSFRLLCDECNARDITQEVFIKAWMNIHQYKKQYAFSTWIYKITYNACYDKLRLEKNKKIAVLNNCNISIGINADELTHLNDLKKLILRITKCLPPKQRLVFTLSEIEELEVEEIRVITGMTSSKIKSNLYHAKKYIKSKIAEQ